MVRTYDGYGRDMSLWYSGKVLNIATLRFWIQVVLPIERGKRIRQGQISHEKNIECDMIQIC